MVTSTSSPMDTTPEGLALVAVMDTTTGVLRHSGPFPVSDVGFQPSV